MDYGNVRAYSCLYCNSGSDSRHDSVPQSTLRELLKYRHDQAYSGWYCKSHSDEVAHFSKHPKAIEMVFDADLVLLIPILTDTQLSL